MFHQPLFEEWLPVLYQSLVPEAHIVSFPGGNYNLVENQDTNELIWLASKNLEANSMWSRAWPMNHMFRAHL